MTLNIRSIILCTMLAVGVISARGQGLYWETLITQDGKNDSTTSQSYYRPKMFKVTGMTDDMGIIVRLDKQLFIMINDGEKEYSQLSFEQIERMMKQVTSQFDGQLAEMEKQMANMPPDQRKMIEEMMADKMPGRKSNAKYEVAGTGDTKKISGYSCGKHVVKRDGEEIVSLWTTDDVEGVESLSAEMKEFGKRMAALNPMGDPGEHEAMMSVEGFPMLTKTDNVTTLVTKITEKEIPASEFEVPAGYKLIEPEMMGGGGR